MEKKMYKLTINDDLAHLMPPLTAEEEAALTGSLLESGCREPLVVWKGIVVDGHNRYRICWRHGIPFSYVEMDFDSENAAKLWCIKNQVGRRNLTDFQKCELVLPFEDALRTEAKKRQGWRSDLKTLPTARGNTRDFLAEMAGVSHDTFAKVKAILSTADADTVRRVRKGEISIHRAYLEVAQKSHAVAQKKPRAKANETVEVPMLIVGPVPDINEILLPIGEAVRGLLDRVSEGEATTKLIIVELTRVIQMIDEAGRP